MKSIEDFTGFSESGIDDAIQNALKKQAIQLILKSLKH